MPDNRSVVDPPAIVRPAHDLAKVLDLIRQAEVHRQRGIAEFIQAGEKLIRAKAVCPSGCWLNCLAELKVHPSTAARQMNVAKAFYNRFRKSEIPNLKAIVDILANAATRDETEPEERPITSTSADEAILALILCDRCTRTGAVPNCKKCDKVRASFKRKAGRRKGGKLLFDWKKKLEGPLGVIIRASDELVKKYEAEAKSAEHRRIETLLSELAEVVGKWKAKILGLKK